MTPTGRPAPLRRLRTVPEPTAVLACLPHAGGGASSFRPLSTRPAFAEYDVLAMQYPGHEDRLAEPPADSIEQLAAEAAEAISARRSRCPLLLLGHSMGASVAVETCALLESGGQAPALLVVSARRAPGHPDRPGAPVALRSDDDLVAELAGWGGTPPEALANLELRELMLPVLRHDLGLLERYRPRRSGLRTPLLVLWGQDDPTTAPDDPNDWARVSAGTTQVRVFPGGHFFLTQEGSDVAEAIVAAARGL